MKLPTAGIDALAWGVHLRQVGAELLFAFGPVTDVPVMGRSEATVKPEQLGPLWLGQSEQLVYVRCDAEDAAAELQELAGLVALHHEDIAERITRLRPGAGLQLEALVSRLGSAEGKWELSAAIGDILEYRVRSDLGPVDGDVESELKELPRELLTVLDSSGSFLATSIPLDWMLQVGLTGFRDEVTMRAGREQSRGRTGFATRIRKLFDEQLVGLQEYLEGEDSAVFAPGSAVIQGAPTEVLDAYLTRPGAPARSTDLVPSGGLAKVDGLALVGILADGEDGQGFVERMTGGLAAAMGGAVPIKLRSEDLGLGVPTQVVDWVDLQGGDSRLALAGDVKLHWFRRGSLLVLSTSVPLSRAILSARADSARGRVMVWSRSTGAHWARTVEQLLAVHEALDQRQAVAVRSKLGFAGPLNAEEKGALQALARALRTIGVVEARDTLEGPIYTQRMTVRWAR